MAVSAKQETATQAAGPATAPSAGAASAAKTKVKAAAAKKKKSNRLLELDGLRNIMFIVVFFHAYQSSSGDSSNYAIPPLTTLGTIVQNLDALLPIFFILSGFALYYQMFGAIMLGRKLPDGRTFLVNRALRLLPIYYLIFFVVWIWRFGGGADQWTDLFWGVTLTQSWSTEHIFRVVDPGWYLSVEWHFSLFVTIAILPWLRLIASWPTRSRIFGALVPPVVLIGITVWWKSSLIDRGISQGERGSWFAPPSWALLYAVGMLLGMALVLRPQEKWRLPKPGSILIFIAATSWGLYVMSHRGPSVFYAGWFFDLALFCTLGWMIAVITADPDGLVRRVLRSKPSIALAGASYATYLIHAPIMKSLNERGIFPLDDPKVWPYSTAAIIVTSLTVGYLAHRFIEMPLSKLSLLLKPKLDNTTKIHRASKPTVLVGTPLPASPVVDTAGQRFTLGEVCAQAPMLLLIHPIEPVPRNFPAVAGVRSAMRALDGSRFAARGFGIRLASMSPKLMFLGDNEKGSLFGQSLDENDDILRIVDPGAKAVRELGAAVFQTEGGETQPEIVVLAIDQTGEIVAVVRDDDRHLMIGKALRQLSEHLGVASPERERHEPSAAVVASQPASPAVQGPPQSGRRASRWARALRSRSL